LWFQGKYVVLFFYPLDFTFVCPTEITAFSDRFDEFKKINTEVSTTVILIARQQVMAKLPLHVLVQSYGFRLQQPQIHSGDRGFHIFVDLH
jgi:hypothetical protein